jgi:two-component system sensor histidine kinase KdpD
LTVALGAGAAFLMSFFLGNPHLSMAFLVAVLVVALRLGLAPALYASFLSLLAFNFLFTQPRYTLHVAEREDVVTLLFFLLVSVVSGKVAARARAQLESIRGGARTNALLFDFSRRIAGAMGRDDLAWSVCEYVSETLQCEAIVLLRDDQGKLNLVAGGTPPGGLIPIDCAAARWALEHNEPAGSSSGTLPDCRWYFVPLRAAERPSGVLGITVEEPRWTLSSAQRRLLLAMRDQAGVALERMRLAEEIESAQLVSETEKLRSALLSSVSHDLRTPLVSIIGSTSTLLELPDSVSREHQRELLKTIQEEAERLNHFVQNLLDMTRLGYGALVPNRQWSDLRDSVADALRRLKPQLAQHPVTMDVPADFPWLFVDPVLTEQVLVNLLDNAAKYSPAGSPIVIRARVVGDRPTIEVADAGPGIPAEAREAVFDMFHRIKAGDTRTAGTGLGLAICRGFVNAMGGTIAAKSGPHGQGTRMEFTLPSGPQPSLPEEEHAT